MLFTILITKLYAVPAYPFPIKYTQPDGSEITIQLKGDERVHWAETSDGYTLLSNGKNGWEYAVADSNGDLKTSGILAREVGKRTLTELKLLKGVSKNNRFSTKQVKTLKSVWEAKFGSEKLVGVSDFFRPN
ncbi:MAG: family metalloprotease domain protein, partial [Bacteroidetes bacterium]|nr:family metalloprotease domain protein [Bacteroidota bacterium]